MNPSPRIRLLVVDDHPIVREGLRNLVMSVSWINLVAACPSGDAALNVMRRQAIDVAMMELRMRPMDGVEVLRRMRLCSPRTKGLILSSYEFEEQVFQAVEVGAAGYINKSADTGEILQGIAAVHAGQQVFPPRLLERLEQRQKKSLTPRELEVLGFVAKGLTNKEIGDVLGLSQFTVRNQLRRVSVKLDASDRTEVTRVAIEQGIILI